MSKLEEKVDFNRIRYANVWEDADVLLSSLQLAPNAEILCVASAGDNALALLSTNPACVYAVDLSEPQLHLTGLKIACFKLLDYDEMLRFLGVNNASHEERLALLDRLSSSLSPEANSYWLQNKEVIGSGIIYQGKFEHYFKLFRTYLLPLVHGKRIIDKLLQPKTGIEQRDFYHHKWNTWRWRLLMNFFFSKRIMGRYGRDPEFLKHVEVDVPTYIRNKAEQHLQSSLATQNYFLHFIFKGMFGNGLPFYLRQENFNAIKANIDRIILVKDDVNSLVAQQPFDAYCLSNIFEYFSETQFKDTVNQWTHQLRSGDKLAFWNLMAPRSFSETDSAAFKSLPTNAASDKGFFYSNFLLEEKI